MAADEIVPCSECVFERFGDCYFHPTTVIGINGGPMYCRPKAKGGCGQGKAPQPKAAMKEVPPGRTLEAEQTCPEVPS